jgi:hypothetical protein
MLKTQLPWLRELAAALPPKALFQLLQPQAQQTQGTRLVKPRTSAKRTMLMVQKKVVAGGLASPAKQALWAVTAFAALLRACW